MEPPVVPYTRIFHRYHEVRSLDDQSRVKLARDLTGELLASDFVESIATLDAGYKSDASFRPKPRTPRKPRQSGIANGPDLAWYMHRQRTLHVQADSEPSLDVQWVDYEVSVLSTRGGAVFDKPIYGSTKTGAPPPRAGNPLKADLLLVNADPADRTPVIAEVKVKRDKEPFSALVQLLAYIAHLSTPSQYARLRTHFEPAGYPDTDPARFDGYLLLYKFGESRSTWLDDLLAESERLSAELMRLPQVTAHIRRLASINVSLDDHETLVATKRWLHAACS